MANVVIDINANDNVSKIIANIQRNLDRLQRNAGRAGAANGGGGRRNGNDIGGFGNIFEAFAGAQIAVNALNSVKSAIIGLGKASLEQARLMEQAQKRLSLVGGGRFGGQQLAGQVSGFAQQYGLSREATIESFSKFAVSASEAGLTSKESQSVFENTAKAIAAMGLSAEDTKGVFLAFSQMLGKGKASSEELRQQLAERIPGAMALAAKSMNMTMPEFTKQLEDGNIKSKELVMNLTNLFGKKYGEAASENLTTLEGKLNTLENAMFELKGAITDSLGPATMRMIEALSTKILGLAGTVGRFFGQSIQSQEAGGLAGEQARVQKENEGKSKADLQKSLEERQKMMSSFMSELGTKLQNNPELMALLDPSTAANLQKSFQQEEKFVATYGGLNQQGRENIRKQRETFLSQAQKQLSEQPVLPIGEQPATMGSVLNPFGENFGRFTTLAARASSGANKNTEIFNQTGVRGLITTMGMVGVGLDATQKSLDDLGKKMEGEKQQNETLTTKGKEKLKTDFHTPKIININILSGNGSSLISGGVSTTIQSTQTDANSIKTQLQTMIEQSMIEILTDTGTSLSRIATSQ